MSEQIIKTEFSDVMQKSYIDYAMSVNCQRALPDVRDGLSHIVNVPVLSEIQWVNITRTVTVRFMKR